MAVEMKWEHTGFYRRFYDVVEPDDLMIAVSALHDDERFESCTYTINDFIDVSSVNVQMSDIIKISLRTIAGGRKNSAIRMVVIATHPEVKKFSEFFISPRYNPYLATIVETVSEAREWVRLGGTDGALPNAVL